VVDFSVLFGPCNTNSVAKQVREHHYYGGKDMDIIPDELSLMLCEVVG
jgi:hypothetical protein